MRFIHSRLRTDHHLKYFARQQYGLFLKGAGLSLDGSISLFRQEFTKKMDIDKVT
jgi:DNA primase large subunit